MAAVLLSAAPSLGATLSTLTSFGGGDGYLAPGDRAYLANDNNQRGLAWNPTTNNLLLVNRTGALSINVLDGVTGDDEGILNQGLGVITGGTFAGSMIAAADDGAIYMSNLTTNATTSAYKVYRWASESAATPTVAYSGAPLAGARLGDSLDLIGGGASTRIVAGYSNNPAVAGNNTFALLTTADGTIYTSETIAVGTNPPAAGDFRFGITFTDADTVIGKSGASGRFVDITGAGVGALSSSFTLDGSFIAPMDYAVVGGVPYLAAVNTATAGESKLWVYNMSNAASPQLVGTIDNLPGAANANGNGVGQVRFGAITGNSAVIYVLNANNGIQAFKLQGIPEPTSVVMLGIGLISMAAARTRRDAR
jgi:hypothetical protein